MSRPIVLAAVDASVQMGGAEHLLLRLLTTLPRHEVRPLLVSPADGPFPSMARQAGVEVLTVPMPCLRSVSRFIGGAKLLDPAALACNMGALARASSAVAKALQPHRVDVIQSNSAMAHVYGGLAARRLGVPCTWYIHDMAEGRRMLGLAGAAWRALRRALATTVVADSWAACRALGGGSRMRAIHPGTATASTPTGTGRLREMGGIPAGEQIVGYVGRVAPVKGLEALVRAAANLRSSGIVAHIVVVGGALFGEDAYEQMLRRLVSELGLADRWHWLGYQAVSCELMADMDVVVLPSVRETFGLVLVEAGMAGKPVVASRVGGIPEIVIDGVTGVLVPPSRPDSLASAVRTLLADASLRATMGAAGRARALSAFSMERYISDFIEEYRSLVRPKGVADL